MILQYNGIENLSKLKDCESQQPWIKSLCNHLYWVPASTPSGHGQMDAGSLFAVMCKTFMNMMETFLSLVTMDSQKVAYEERNC